MRRLTFAAFVIASLALPRPVAAEHSPARALTEPAAMPTPGDGE